MVAGKVSGQAVQSLTYRLARKRRGRGAALLTALPFATAAMLPMAATADALPASFEASYRISAKGLAVARMTRRFVSGRGAFSVRDETRTTGLAGLLRRESVSETSSGLLQGTVMLPTRYRYERQRKRGTKERELSFDWETSGVRDEIHAASWPVALTRETFDKLAYQVAIMRDLAAGRRTLSYRIADDQRIKVYELATQGEETITTPSGSFVALRLSRTNAGGDRRTTFWCAGELGYLPVRVEHEDDGTVTVAELIDYQLLGSEAPPDSGVSAGGPLPEPDQDRPSKNSIKRSAGT